MFLLDEMKRVLGSDYGFHQSMSIEEIKKILEKDEMNGTNNVPFMLEAGNLDIEMVIDPGEYLNDVKVKPVSLEYFCCVRTDGEWESHDTIFEEVNLDVPDVESEMFRVLCKYAKEEGLSFFSQDQSEVKSHGMNIQLETPLLETAVDLAFNAGAMTAKGVIEIEDSREMVAAVKNLAIEFEKGFNHDSADGNYLESVDKFAEEKLAALYGRKEGKPVMRCDDFSIKYSPAVGDLLTVVFMDGSCREIDTAAGDALRCWEQEFYVNADRISEAWIDDKAGRRSWMCGGPDNIRPTEKIKIINNRHVYIGGTWYEITTPGGGDVHHYGDCEPEMTPRQVYNHYFPRPDGDGVKYSGVTLFFIDATGKDVIHMTDRTVSLDVFDYNNDAMDDWRDFIPCGYDRRREGYILTYAPKKPCARPFIWPERPRIILAEGEHVTLPWWVLYKNSENDFILKYHRSSEKLDAITRYLDHAGQKWHWM